MTTKFLCAALCFLAAAFVGIECKTRFSRLPLTLRRLTKFRHVNNEKIIGGEEVEPHSIPHQVSIQDKKSGFHFCSGSIITNKTIVTAAQCCYLRDEDDILVVAGEHDLSENEGTEQVVGVRESNEHNFDPITFANDLCVMVLREELEFNEAVGPCTLPKPDQKFTGDAVVSGWGALDSSSIANYQNKLRAVTVPIISDKECRQDYEEEQFLDSVICAGEAGKGLCKGDTGGPMTCNGTHCGISSWGPGCGQPGFPGVYTETSHFLSFIMLFI